MLKRILRRTRPSSWFMMNDPADLKRVNPDDHRLAALLLPSFGKLALTWWVIPTGRGGKAGQR